MRRSLRAGFRLVLAVAGALTLSACASMGGYPKPVSDPNADITAVQPYFAADVLQKYHSASDADRGGMTARIYRDAVVNGRVLGCRVRFEQFERSLWVEGGTANLVSDGIVITANAVGAAVTDTTAKTALAALSGGVVGLKGSIDKNLFYDKALPALVAQMKAGRDKALVPIRDGLTHDTPDYPLERGLHDVDDYCAAGSLPAAIAGVTESAGATSAEAKVELAAISRDAAYRDALPQEKALLVRAKALTADQALALAFYMEPSLKGRSDAIRARLANMDPNGRHLTSGDAAKLYLLRWLAEDDRSAASLAQWSAALDMAEKH